MTNNYSRINTKNFDLGAQTAKFYYFMFIRVLAICQKPSLLQCMIMAFSVPFISTVFTPGRRQRKTLLTIDEGESKIDKKQCF